MENRKLQEKNDYLRTFCDDLEQIVVKLDSVKRTYDSNNAGPGGDNSNNTTYKNFNDPEMNWNEKMLALKSKLSVNEPQHQTETNQSHQEQEEEVEREEFATTNEVNNIVFKESVRASNTKTADNPLLQTPTKFLHSNSGTPMSNQNLKTRASSNCSVRFEVPKHETGGQIQANKDYTAELFDSFERNTFQKKPETSLQETSFIGNIKIHEVDKNGQFVRILNTSNTVEEDLGNFTIQQMIAAMPVAVYRFPPAVKLMPGRITSVWCNNDEIEQQPPHVFVWKEQNKWSTGPECTTVLSKPNGQVRNFRAIFSCFKNILTISDVINAKSMPRSQLIYL